MPKCCAWINEKNALNAQQYNVKLSDVYRFLSILLFSNTARFSLGNAIELLARIGLNVPGKDIIKYIYNKILASSPIDRGRGGMTWTARRDETQLLCEFERTAFRSTRKIFFNPDYLLATLDDDVYGTRARDNQVKSLSTRKAEKEGHIADVIDDALFRVILRVRFRRRSKSQEAIVRKLLSSILDGTGQMSPAGITVTGGRGYGKLSLVKKLREMAIGSILIMPNHLICCHTFSARSYCSPYREDDKE